MSEKEVVKGFTVKAIVIGIIIVFATMLFWSDVRVPVQWYNYQLPNAYWDSTFVVGHWLFRSFSAIVLTLLILAVVNTVAGKNLFSRAEAALISILAPISAVLLVGHWGKWTDWAGMEWLSLASGLYIRDYSKYGLTVDKIGSILPNFIGTKDQAVVQAMLPPNAPLNLGPWMPGILWITALAASFIITYVCLMLLVQRVWIENERITLPYANLQMELVDMTQHEEGGRVRFWTNRYFLIGFIISLVWFGGTHYYTWMPDVWLHARIIARGLKLAYQGTFWVGGPYVIPYWTVSQYLWDVLPYAALVINLTPWLIGWGMLNNIQNLVGVLVGALVIHFIIPPLLYFAGVMGPPGRGVAAQYDPLGDLLYTGASPFPEYMRLWGTLIVMGMLVAIVLIPTWLNRERFAPILKALWKKPPVEVDAESPIPYRIVWVILIASVLGSWLLMTAAGGHIWVMLLYVLALTILQLGAIRVLSETGGYFGSFSGLRAATSYVFPYAIIAYFFIILFPAAYEKPWTQTSLTTMLLLTFFSPITWAIYNQWTIRSGWTTLSAIKVAGEAKLKKRTVLQYLVGIMIAVVFLSLIRGIMDWYAWDAMTSQWLKGAYYALYGADILLGAAVCCSSMVAPESFGLQSAIVRTAVKYPAHMVSYFIIGFLVVAVLYYMRGRFPWFIVGPAGFILGFLCGQEVWAAFLVALLIKYLAMRVGGVELLNKKVQPLFIGLLAGYFLFFIFGDLGGFIVTTSKIP